MYFYIKALHLIFMVTWFAGMFYIVRLFIYQREAHDRIEPERSVLQKQFSLMSRRLWLGITWPSAVLTLVFGPWTMFYGNWHTRLSDASGRWLLIKLVLVFLLYLYHFSLHRIYRQQQNGLYPYSSQQLRIWNEVATIFLVAIVMLASVKSSLSFVWGLAGLIGLVIILMTAIRIYKKVRGNSGKQ